MGVDIGSILRVTYRIRSRIEVLQIIFVHRTLQGEIFVKLIYGASLFIILWLKRTLNLEDMTSIQGGIRRDFKLRFPDLFRGISQRIAVYFPDGTL